MRIVIWKDHDNWWCWRLDDGMERRLRSGACKTAFGAYDEALTAFIRHSL